MPYSPMPESDDNFSGYDAGERWRWDREHSNSTERTNAMDINDMTFDQLVPSKSQYLAKDDVGEDGLILTIKGFRMETVKTDDGDDDKMVMHFVENVKPMIVNRTNSQLIGIATGAKTAGDAKGKKIVVYNDPTVSFGGKVTGGLRIKKIVGQPKSAPASAEDPNDEIPF